MATYVNDLRLTELATGEGSGTWGVTTNTNLELIGEALGYGTQDCFATDADATTTVADGASDPARAMYFKVTSSATLTATRTLTIAPNTMTRVMLIENATTGSQSIAISQGSGGNVTIASGQVKMVYLDGAGAGAAVVDAMASLELGTITVANLTATTADINGGTIDGTTIATSDITVGSGKTLDVSAGTFTVANDQISGDAINGGTATPTTLTSTTVNATTVDTTNIEVTNLKAKDGTSAGSIADSTGVVTLASSVLTTTDINGGSVDGVTLGTNSAVTEAQIDNININGNTISSTDTNGNVTITPDGTGSVAISKIDVAGGEIDGTAIGANSASTAVFTDLTASGTVSFSGATVSDGGTVTTVNIDGGNIDGTIIGAASPAAGSFTTGQFGTSLNVDGAVTADGADLDGAVVINESGADADFRVESDTNTHALFVDAGNDRVGIATSSGAGKLSVYHNFTTTSRLLSLTSGSGVVGGVTGTVYGIYAQVKANNDASEVYGAYFDVNQGTNDNQTGVYAEVGPVSGSNKRGIGVLGSVTLNTDTTGQNPLDRNDDAVTGVFAEALGASTAYSSTLSALSAVNSSTYGLTNYGAVIRSAVPTTPASTNSIPLRVYYGSDILFDVRGNGTGGDSETVVNQGSIDHDFRVESDGSAHMLFVDAGNNRVGINSSSPGATLDVAGGNITAGQKAVRITGNTTYIADGSYGTSLDIAHTFNSNDGSFRAINIDVTDGGTNNQTLYGLYVNAEANYFSGNTSIGAAAVINESGGDNNFRVESDTNTHMLFVDAGNDRVGVGTNSPAAALDVSGANDLAISNKTAAPTNSQSLPGVLSFQGNGWNTSLGSEPIEGTISLIGSYASGQVRPAISFNLRATDEASLTESMRITSDNLLLAYGGAIVNEDGADADFRVETDSITHALFVDAGNNTVNINYSNGNKPASAAGTQLQIGQNNNASQIFHDGTTADKGFISGTANDDYVFYEGPSSGVWNERLRLVNGGEAVFNDGSLDRDFRVESDSNTHALFVDAGNNRVGVGTSSPSEALHVVGNIVASGDLLVGTTTAVGTAATITRGTGAGPIMTVGTVNNTGSCIRTFVDFTDTRTHIDFYRGTTILGSITSNGTTTSYNTSSDYRLKRVDGPIENSGAYIDSLNPVRGAWIEDGKPFIGLIAHEVQEVSETFIATGEKDGEEMQAMDYAAPELIANLIAEIQSLRARVAQLEGA